MTEVIMTPTAKELMNSQDFLTKRIIEQWDYVGKINERIDISDERRFLLISSALEQNRYYLAALFEVVNRLVFF